MSIIQIEREREQAREKVTEKEKEMYGGKINLQEVLALHFYCAPLLTPSPPPLPLLSAPCVLTMCFNTWTVALHFTRKTTALLTRAHIQTCTYTLAQMIKWQQMTGQQGYLTSWNFAEVTERLLNPGRPLMKHRGRQRNFPFNLSTMRRSRCLRFIHNLHTS